MDSSILVSAGHELLDTLEAKGLKPRAAMWVHNTDIDTWKLWVVPPKNFSDQRAFYRQVVEAIAESGNPFPDIDASDVEMVSDSHPAIASLAKLIKVTDKSSVTLHNNKLGNFYLADGIILRMDI
ncbi:MAG: hypothetical protein ACKVP3_02135 [Hyphomicrobiaceae bacterium]